MKLVIFGTSEIACCAYEYFTHDSPYDVVAFSVDEAYLNNQDCFLGLPLVNSQMLLEQFSPANHHVFVAIGSGQLNRVRTKKYHEMKNKGYTLASYISTKAFIWHNVTMGENAFILEDNTLQPFVTIGNNVTLWSGNHIGHSSKIEDNCFISSHVVISGLCTIGSNTFIGVNATVGNNIQIGQDNYIGMGTIVSHNTENASIIRPTKNEISKISALKFCRVEE